MAITSIAQLQKAVEARVQKALQLTQNEIYAVVKKHLVAFYQAKDFPHGNSEGNSIWSNEPLYYQRTNTFLESLIKTQVVRVGNSLACSVQLGRVMFLRQVWMLQLGLTTLHMTTRMATLWAAARVLHGGMMLWRNSAADRVFLE